MRRRWSAGAVVGFVLLNPSTADETLDDPTIRRCIGFAKALGYGGLTLGNLFALRSTDPRALRSDYDPEGPSNDQALLQIATDAQGNIICGWGNHGAFMNRGREVLRRFRAWGATPTALALTKAGEPAHPLYLRGDLRPFPLSPWWADND